MAKGEGRARKPLGGTWSWEIALQTNVGRRVPEQLLRRQELEWNATKASRNWALC